MYALFFLFNIKKKKLKINNINNKSINIARKALNNIYLNSNNKKPRSEKKILEIEKK